MTGNCGINNANAGRYREGSLYDSLAIPAAGALASKTFFNNDNSGGVNLCNLPQKGELGDGESFIVKAVGFEFVGTAVADIYQVQKHMSFTLEIGSIKVIKDQPIANFPIWGSAFGIEGANGASSVGSLGWHSVKQFDTPITILGKQSIRGFLTLGTAPAGAIHALAAISAAGLFCRCHLYGEDRLQG